MNSGTSTFTSEMPGEANDGKYQSPKFCVLLLLPVLPKVTKLSWRKTLNPGVYGFWFSIRVLGVYASRIEKTVDS